mmetsp:Transcript_38503/g.58593  ORF Transcript_38503/g.58593 Transcript_38503/m.58593 type:complete len:130 (+) Transcript_38503:446-835(+)
MPDNLPATKIPVSQPTKPIPQAPREAQTGKWTAEEHSKFLEGLRLFGKDYLELSKFIGTRSTMNVKSHASKFLIKLVRFLDSRSKIDYLTVEEAEVYCGLLRRKLNKAEQLHKKEAERVKVEPVKRKIF